MLPDAMEGLPKGWPSIFAGIAIFSLLCVEELAMVCANASGSADSAKTVTPNTLENGTVAVNTDYYALKDPAIIQNTWEQIWKDSPRKLFSSMRQPQASCSCCAPPNNQDEQNTSGALQSCEANMMIKGQSVSSAKAVCLFVALSFHSVMEGVGVGTRHKFSMLMSVSIAILAHKGLAAFALGSALRNSSLRPTQIAWMAVVFALGTPAGIILGILVTKNCSGPMVAACTALAAGTFLQVAMMEIIPMCVRNLAETGSTIKGLACLGFGFAVMSFTVQLIG